MNSPRTGLMCFTNCKLFLFASILSFTFSCAHSKSAKVDLMTYNIRLDHAGDEADNWHQRKADLVEYIKKYTPDFFGVQEALSNQMDYLLAGLPEYDFVGVGRDDGKRAGEFSAVFFKKADWKVKESGTFWLSQTPDEPSLGWDANIKRVCSYGRFENKNGLSLFVFNTHFDHQGKQARAGSVDLLSQRVPELAKGTPFVLMGDFNFSPDDPLYAQITAAFNDSFIEIEKEVPAGTFNGFRLNEVFDRRIDYIFVKNEQVVVESFAIDQPKTKKGRQLSDHFPVMVTVKF